MWSPETSPEQRRAMVAGLQQPPLAPPPAYHQTSSPTAIITDNFQGSLIQAQTTNYAVPAGPKGKAKARSRAPAKPRATTTSASKVTKTKSKKSSAPAPAVVRSIEELYAAQFDSLSHEEKCRLMLPLLQGFNPLSPCPPPCTSPSPSPEGAEPSLPIARSGQDLAMVQQAIDELGPAALGGAMRQQEALQRTQTRRR
ncbi:hypothetical protein T440DRAFT_465345 [Plenodomus tracheiphilus IPT5]|uniref:Uncharacterized protein n=1 Tax=Plenodomus tracheiphilus IPT5 TaxID=1408161 RepID=A0A6A7BG46_9PLEO|nr:hypothetical protein T440DRAFT_465345 [Plenodomus tracheiphilus IPT5]